MKSLTIISVITFFILFVSRSSKAALSPEFKNDTTRSSRISLPLGKVNAATIEKYSGKKLKFKEKIALLLLKAKIKKTSPKQSHATIALILGICSILFVFTGMFFLSTPWTAFVIFMCLSLISALFAWFSASKIKKNDPGRKKTTIAKILASISLFVLLVILVIALLVLALVNSL